MAYTLDCKDAGESSCAFVAHGETKEEGFEQTAKHAKEVHRHTDEELNDPKLIEQMKAIMKEA